MGLDDELRRRFEQDQSIEGWVQLLGTLRNYFEGCLRAGFNESQSLTLTFMMQQQVFQAAQQQAQAKQDDSP